MASTSIHDANTPEEYQIGLARTTTFEKRLIGQSADPRISALNNLILLSTTIMWEMISFFTEQWKFNYTYAASVRNIWSGTILVLPLILIHVADTFTGNFYVISLGSVLYTIGLGILSASNPPRTCEGTALQVSTCARKENINLYAGLAISALGLSGIGVSLTDFQAEDALKQDDDVNPVESCKGFFLNLVMVAFGIILMLIYFNKIKSWPTQFLIAAVFIGFASVCFMTGKRQYRACTGLPQSPESRLIVTILRVLVGSTLKLFCKHPGRLDLYQAEGEKESLEPTKGLGCLDKAAIITPGGKTIEEQKKNRWRLSTATEVEQTKIVFRMFPLWGTWIILGVVSSMGDTYFLEQANHLNPMLGKLKVPLIALLAFQKLGGFMFGTLIESACRMIVPEQCKRARSAIIVAMAMVVSTLCCIVAAKVEQKRLWVVQRSGLIDKPEDRIPMTIFLLVPQFMLLGVLDKLFENGSKDFVRGFMPITMIRYMILSTDGINGFGRIGGVISVVLVGKFSHQNNQANWFQNTLNKSRLDKYFLALAKVSAVSLAAYVPVVCWYFYRESNRPELDDNDDIDHSNFVQDNSNNCCCCC